MIKILALVSLAALAAGCGGSDASVDLSGSWTGTWQNSSPAYTGSVSVTVMQSGASLSGSGTLTGLPAIDTAQGTVDAMVSGSSVYGAVKTTATQADFQLSVSADGRTLSGSYTMSPGNFTGVMTLTR